MIFLTVLLFHTIIRTNGDWEKVREGCVFLLPCVLKINLQRINYTCICPKASRGVSKCPEGNQVLQQGHYFGILFFTAWGKVGDGHSSEHPSCTPQHWEHSRLIPMGFSHCKGTRPTHSSNLHPEGLTGDTCKCAEKDIHPQVSSVKTDTSLIQLGSLFHCYCFSFKGSRDKNELVKNLLQTQLRLQLGLGQAYAPSQSSSPTHTRLPILSAPNINPALKYFPQSRSVTQE